MVTKVEVLRGHPYDHKYRKQGESYYIDNRYVNIFVAIKKVKIVFEDDKTAPKDDKIGKKEYFAKKQEPKKVLTQKTVEKKKETPKKEKKKQQKKSYQKNDMFKYFDNVGKQSDVS